MAQQTGNLRFGHYGQLLKSLFYRLFVYPGRSHLPPQYPDSGSTVSYLFPVCASGFVVLRLKAAMALVVLADFSSNSGCLNCRRGISRYPPLSYDPSSGRGHRHRFTFSSAKITQDFKYPVSITVYCLHRVAGSLLRGPLRQIFLALVARRV